MVRPKWAEGTLHWPCVALIRQRIDSILLAEVEGITMGDVADFGNVMGAVIDASSFATQAKAIADADPVCEILVGGQCDDSVGYFVRPTVIVTSDPAFRTMREELFGPVLTVFIYEATPYGLTGAVFARASGTDDKAGSKWNLIRWVSPRATKELLAPPTGWRYPFLASGD